MGKINWARVILGGLVAGVVIFLFEALYSLLMAQEWKTAMQALGRSMEETTTSMILAVVLTFGVGIAAVWLYAVARPRFGPGPKTAACTGVGYWFIGYAFPSIAWGMLVGFPTRLLVITILWTLPEIVAATLAGAWLYRE